MDQSIIRERKHIFSILIWCLLIATNGYAKNYITTNQSFFKNTFLQLAKVVSDTALSSTSIGEISDYSLTSVDIKSGNNPQWISPFSADALPGCVIAIKTIYSENCQEPTANNYTADWKIGIEVEDAPDNAITYQRNSGTTYAHTLTGTTDTLTIVGIPADGGAYDTIKVWFTNELSCVDTVILKRPSPCPTIVSGTTKPAEVCTNLSTTEIGGTAFEDSDFDGVMNQNDTIGVEGVKVYIYDDCNNVVDSTYTDSNGNYLFTGLTVGTTYRVEFNLPESVSCWAKVTQKGTDNGTAIQYRTPGNCASIGLASPSDYCDTTPKLAAPCYINGDPVPNGSTSGTQDWLVVFDYDNTGSTDDGSYDEPQTKVSGEVIGSTWGLAYHRGADTLLAGAFLKRHVGLGTGGTGAIYKIEPTTGNASLFIDLNSYPNVNTGTDPRDGSVNNTLPTSGTDSSVDLDAFSLVGKIGLGDIELSADEKTLYAINLFEKTLVKIPFGDNLTAPSSVETFDIATAIVSLFSGDDVCGNVNDYRPFGLKIHRGKVYVGVVCSAEDSGDETELQAYIIALDLINPSLGFQAVYTFPLTYARHGTDGRFNNPSRGEWLPWESDDYTNMHQNGPWTIHPSPIVSDIEFDSDGSMILGFIDRTGHQVGFRNYQPIAGTTTLTNAVSAGDVLRICHNNGVYELEGIGSCPTNGTGHPFYTIEEFYPNENVVFGGGDEMTDFQHSETSNGGISLNKTTNQMVLSVLDPFNGDANSGGVETWNSQNGNVLNEYELFDTGSSTGGTNNSFGKSHGLGDVEMLCESAPIEIGNYIWYDQDNDGIQDACEPGIPGVQVYLRSSTGTTLDIYTSDANGQYYFGESASGYKLEPNTTYYLVFGLFGGFDSATQLLYDSLRLSQPNVVSGTMPDEIDSDATITSTGFPTAIRDYPHIQVVTGNAGYVDHSFDVGFYQPCRVETAILSMSECTVNGGNAEVDITFMVDWAASGNIEVKMNGVAQTIDVQNGAVSPDTFTYTIPADLAQNTFLAYNVEDTACGDTTNIIAPPACNPCIEGTNIIGGNVFTDYNFNGINDDGGNMQAGIKVYIYGCDMNGNSTVIDSAITDYYGAYSFDTGITDGEDYRVEFVIPDSLNFLEEGFNGANSNTSVQFVTAPTCSVDLGVASPSDFCQTTPRIATTCFVTQAYNGAYPDSAALVTFPIDATGDANDVVYTYPTILATHGQIGSTYGLAYSKELKSYFASAFLKRASGFGPNGPGAIYKIDDAGSVSLHTDLNTLFPGSAGADPHDFTGDASSLSYDDASSPPVGKVSLGDMELSIDGQSLYVVNLNDKKLYVIPVNEIPTTGNVMSFALPTPGDCPASSYNPFGLGIGSDGKIYIGAVCSSSLTTAGIEAYVYRFDGVSAFTNVLQYDLDFAREVREWSDWEDSPSSSTDPAPMFTDIEFNGNEMVMGIRDRRGDQYYSTSPSVLGDIYKAYWNGQDWILEDNAFSGTKLGEDFNKGNGPGGGRYYDLSDGVAVDAAGMGGLLMIKGGHLVSTIMDPYRTVSAGVVHFDDTGAQTNLYEVYQIAGSLPVPLFGKSNGLGDLQAQCEAAPIEIGNYVWQDTNEDGIQDPCEPPLAGINVTLYDMNGDSLTTVQTDSNGEYYFNDQTTGLDTLLPNTMYFIVIGEGGQFDTSNSKLTLLGTQYNLTIDSTGQGTIPRQNDSDGTLASGVDPDFDGQPYVKITTGNSGTVDHTIDFGFSPDQGYDYGDLPDIANGTTGITDYETYDSTGGPSHLIIEGLFLGDTVDVDTDGYPDAAALGDDTDNVDDEDGLTIFSTLNITPGGNIRLPLTFTNSTGNLAYIEGWIDWNGDGDFDEPNEMIIDMDDIVDGDYSTFVEITVPEDALSGNLLGVRIRLSNTDNMTPYGQVNSGEVEDYLIGIECPQVICLPIESELKRE